MRRLFITGAMALAIVAVLSTQSVPRQDGASETWQKLLKLKTTASVMHVTAHPDDEHGGVLAKLSRDDGARLALLTLNRGESGDNAIGPQLFDALGLIRTEELLMADRHYGIDEQYFTTVVDYGFSKRLEEALDKWGRETVLRDVVRIIRMSRPTIILSRFQGNERDGHGNHQTAGLMALEGFRAAGDPNRYPEQIAEGLRPWQPKKVYIGGVRENEAWTVRIDSGEYSPRLGDSFDNVARYGLSFQRSQVSGRFTPTAGPDFGYYSRMDVKGAKEASVFDGVPTTIEATVGAAGKPIDDAVMKAMAAFTMNNPSASVASLVDGLRLTRAAIAAGRDPDAKFVLDVKERQFQDAINSALGMELTAVAQPAGVPEPTGPGAAFAPPALMAAPVPGQMFEVRARLANRGGIAVAIPPSAAATGDKPPAASASITIEGDRGWQVAPGQTTGGPNLERHQQATARATITVADDVAISTRPYFSRNGLQESRYTLSDPAQFGKPASTPPLRAVGRYFIDGVPIEIREVVRRREAKLPYGDVLREVRSVPRIAVSMTPSNAIVPSDSGAPKEGVPPPLHTEVSLLHNAESPTTGQVSLRMPAGWKSEPVSQPFAFARSGERSSYRFTVTATSIDARPYQIEAVATASPTSAEATAGKGREYREGYELIDHRDLEVRYLYRPSITEVRGVNVTTVAGLKVGYVMGVGDSVPQGLQQLGAQVTLLDERALAAADLSVYDTIMTGTRAYAVREDLKTYNSRLLDYVKAGGNMIVLYNTQELVPNTFAPFPGELPRTAEEVSEEDSPVTILAPTHQSFNWPNKITAADFDGWVEQRGSKFFTKWDAAYTPMISTFDKNQPPQSGGWLTAKVGKGNWTYFAYALHRQLPYGVAGAYRITANLLALNKSP